MWISTEAAVRFLVPTAERAADLLGHVQHGRVVDEEADVGVDPASDALCQKLAALKTLLSRSPHETDAEHIARGVISLGQELLRCVARSAAYAAREKTEALRSAIRRAVLGVRPRGI